MKQIPTTGEVQGITAVACPAPAAVANFRLWAPMGGARPAAPAYIAPAAGISLGKHAHKPTGMARRINATGWPPGPQDRSSG